MDEMAKRVYQVLFKPEPPPLELRRAPRLAPRKEVDSIQIHVHHTGVQMTTPRENLVEHDPK